jgi:hypothetical protein
MEMTPVDLAFYAVSFLAIVAGIGILMTIWSDWRGK